MAGSSGEFIHLGARSEFSSGESFATVEDLCRAVARHGQPALALTDVCTLAGAPRFHRAALTAGIRPILGLELDLTLPGAPAPTAETTRIRVLAETQAGWRSLVRLCNIARMGPRQAAPHARVPPQLSLSALCGEARGLVVLAGGERGELTAALMARDVPRIEAHLRPLLEAFGPDAVRIELPDPVGDGAAAVALLARASSHYGIPAVAVPRICAAELADEMAWRFFQRDPMLRGGRPRDPRIAAQLPERIGDLIVPPDERCIPADTACVRRRFAEHPEAVAEACELAGRCSVVIPEPDRRFPVHNFTRGVDAESFIWNTAFERARERYGELPAAIKDRLNHEFRHLVDAGLANALVSQARLHEEFDARGIVCGPGAGMFTGSLVASLLGITRLDPVAFGLRFTLPENVASRMPLLEFSVAANQELAALEAFSDLFGGQVCSPGRWQRWRFGGALEVVGATVGLSGEQRSALAGEKARADVRDRETRAAPAHPPDPDTRITSAEGAMWLARRLEGRPRSLVPVPGRHFLTVDPILASLPVREESTREGIPIRICEWSEEELLGLKYAGAAARNVALLDLIGDATAAVRLSEGPGFNPSEYPPDDERAFAFIRDGATAGIAPFEPPAVRRLLRMAAPVDVVSLVRACESDPSDAAPKDLPTILLAFTAAALKAHRPVAFHAAALTQAGVDTRRLHALLHEVHVRRIPVQPLDINCSALEWSAEGRAIRPGLCIVRDLPASAVREIITRRRELAFDDLADLLSRTDPQALRDSHVDVLLRAGALDSFGLERGQLAALLERLLPLLRPKRAERVSGADPLEFFGHSGAWWLREQEGFEELEPGGTAAGTVPRDSDCTSGILLGAPTRDAGEARLRERARICRSLSHRDDGALVSLEGFVDAVGPDSDDPDAILAEFAGVTLHLRGAMARRASSSGLSGKACVATGVATGRRNAWQIDVQDFSTLEEVAARSARVRAIHLDAANCAEEIQHALHGVLRAYPGSTMVRLASRPVRMPRPLARLEGRRVTWCPMLEIELNALVGSERWRLDEPEPQGAGSLRELPGHPASIVRRVFDSLVGGRR